VILSGFVTTKTRTGMGKIAGREEAIGGPIIAKM
jgi:hypothetical protein